MTTSVAASKPLTEAVLTALDAIGRPVGDHARPEGDPPYFVVYSGGTVNLAGSADAPNETGVHAVQVTSVGRTRAGAEDIRDAARSVLLDLELPVDGHTVIYSLLVAGPPITRDDDVTPPLFYAVDVFHICVTPTA